ncbi:MAG: hypothetical protein ACETVN_00200 [Asgard group archaeon]
MKRLGLLGIPLDLGANVRGSREGPDKIREFLFPILEKKGLFTKILEMS